MAKKTALICGISGQDGAYLAQLLLGKGYRVVGTSRDATTTSFSNLRMLGLADEVELLSMPLSEFRSILGVLTTVSPCEIYNLSGQSSVGLSFDQPLETMESIAIGTLNLLDAVKFSGLEVSLYNAGSGECFGDNGQDPADEKTPFKPRSPYGTAKAAAFWTTANYRDAYGLKACTGILFNHESPLRPRRFVTQKVVIRACDIALGSAEKLNLGNTEIRRDWGWAPDYVKAMWLMLQSDRPRDYVIATGVHNSLRDFCHEVFDALQLEAEAYINSDESLLRPADINMVYGNAARARRELGWAPTFAMKDVARAMVGAELSRRSQDHLARKLGLG